MALSQAAVSLSALRKIDFNTNNEECGFNKYWNITMSRKRANFAVIYTLKTWKLALVNVALARINVATVVAGPAGPSSDCTL